MYSNYGKSCRSSKKSKTSKDESENMEDTSADDALGDDSDLGPDNADTEGYAGQEGAESGLGEEGEGNEGESTGDGETAADEGVENEESVSGEDSESGGSFDDVEDEEEKKSKRKKGPMEYDINQMYPEINVLIQKKKKEWDYQDPDIIRALWLESKTHVLAEWKVRNAKIKTTNPTFEVKDTVTVTLRQEHLKNKAELQKAVKEREFEMTEVGRDPPHFDSMQLATNLATEMRYKYNRNNPPVPGHYVEHFEKYKKPPFKRNPNTLTCGCTTGISEMK